MAGDPELGDPVDSVVVVMLRDAAKRALGEIEIESRLSDDAGKDRGALESTQVQLWLAELGESGSGRDAADRLVAWLIQRGTEE
jgi:hypothetical protein